MLGKMIPAAVTLAVGAAAAGAAVIKKKNICPVCEVKKAMKRADVHIKACTPYTTAWQRHLRWVGQVGIHFATKSMKI